MRVEKIQSMSRAEKLQFVENLRARRISIEDLKRKAFVVGFERSEDKLFEVSQYGKEMQTMTRSEWEKYQRKHPRWKFVSLLMATGCEPLSENGDQQSFESTLDQKANGEMSDGG